MRTRPSAQWEDSGRIGNLIDLLPFLVEPTRAHQLHTPPGPGLSIAGANKCQSIVRGPPCGSPYRQWNAWISLNIGRHGLSEPRGPTGARVSGSRHAGGSRSGSLAQAAQATGRPNVFPSLVPSPHGHGHGHDNDHEHAPLSRPLFHGTEPWYCALVAGLDARESLVLRMNLSTRHLSTYVALEKRHLFCVGSNTTNRQAKPSRIW